jgi:hypothetical protein
VGATGTKIDIIGHQCLVYIPRIISLLLRKCSGISNIGTSMGYFKIRQTAKEKGQKPNDDPEDPTVF